MPRSYASQFRRMVIEQARNGRRVADVARSVEVLEATVVRWVRQDKIARGEIPGTSSQRSTELRAFAAKRGEEPLEHPRYGPPTMTLRRFTPLIWPSAK